MKTLLIVALLSLMHNVHGHIDSLGTKYARLVAKNLEFLDNNKFPTKPSSGYPWLTVTIETRKAILICPENGIGKAIIVYEDGSVMQRDAKLNEETLSYQNTVQPYNDETWFEFTIDSKWTTLTIDQNNKLSDNIAYYFVKNFYDQARLNQNP